jgi:hypothetical protein
MRNHSGQLEIADSAALRLEKLGFQAVRIHSGQNTQQLNEWSYFVQAKSSQI